MRWFRKNEEHQPKSQMLAKASTWSVVISWPYRATTFSGKSLIMFPLVALWFRMNGIHMSSCAAQVMSKLLASEATGRWTLCPSGSCSGNQFLAEGKVDQRMKNDIIATSILCKFSVVQSAAKSRLAADFGCCFDGISGTHTHAHIKGKPFVRLVIADL